MPPTLPSIVAAILVFLTQLTIYLQSRHNTNKIQELHLTMNSRLDALLLAVAAKARMEGHAEGVRDERANPSPTPPNETPTHPNP